MNPTSRTRLLGNYRTPPFRYGAKGVCERRGLVVLCGLSDARIPWPLGKRGRHKALVLYGDLAKAVRRESAAAVAYWWGVTPFTVWQWRKALGVGATTEGTSRLTSQSPPRTWAGHGTLPARGTT